MYQRPSIEKFQGCQDDIGAWVAATKRAEVCRRRDAQHETRTLQHVLARAAALIVSTSGVESNFGLFKRSRGEHALNASEHVESDYLMLLSEDTIPQETFGVAREVWARVYRSVRSHKLWRIDRGLKRKRRNDGDDGPLTESKFIRAWRTAVADAMASPQVPQVRFPASAEDWGPEHTSESNFNKEKEMARRIEAINAGTLQDEALAPAAAAGRNAALQARGARQRERFRRCTALQVGNPAQASAIVAEATKGRRIYVVGACAAKGVADRIMNLGSQQVLELGRAETIVVPEEVLGGGSSARQPMNVRGRRACRELGSVPPKY